MLQTFEKSISQFFADFWVTNLKPFSGKVKESIQSYFNQNLVVRSYLKNGFEATLSSKGILWAFGKGILQFFASFCVTKLKSLSGKVKQNVRNYLNQNLVIEMFLENGFEASLSSKTNVVSVSNRHFSIFCKFLSGEVETILWKSEPKHSKLFKSKFGHRKLLRKWVLSYLELKNQCCEHLKTAFFRFFLFFVFNFSMTKVKPFSGKVS